MIKPFISTIILSCLTFTVCASEMKSFDEQLVTSINNGSIEVRTHKMLQITPEIAEMIRQINNADMKFDKPILIFSDDEIILNDSKKLNEVLAKTHDTITSM